MSVEEMKKQIVEKVSGMDDEQALQKMLKFLDSEQQHLSFIDPTKCVDQIFKENDGLLKRLS